MFVLLVVSMMQGASIPSRSELGRWSESPIVSVSPLAGNRFHLSWTGGIGPFAIYQTRSLSDGSWTPIATTRQQFFDVPALEGSAFFRIAWSDTRQGLTDISLGPYPSAYRIFVRSVRTQAAAIDVSQEYAASAAAGYLLQALGRFLQAATHVRLPDGENSRDEFVALALAEIEELENAARRVLDGGPAFGLDDAWNAFGDGSTNVAFTAYAWQSGLVALGIAEVARYLRANQDRHPERAADSERIVELLKSMLRYWENRFTQFEEGGESVGYYWYSTAPADNKAVHNVNSSLAMAGAICSIITGEDSFSAKAKMYGRLLAKRWVCQPTPVGCAYAWHYADDGVVTGRRVWEDISHALGTIQFIRFAADRGWYSALDVQRTAHTFRQSIWNGHPAKPNGRVNGGPVCSNCDTCDREPMPCEWLYASPSTIGIATLSDHSAAEADIFDYMRSILVSSYFSPNSYTPANAEADSTIALGLAQLFKHRPLAFQNDSGWSVSAGDPEDNRPPQQTAGGVRFYVIEWNPPAPQAAGSLSLVARAASEVEANILVDLPENYRGRVVVSITYLAQEDGIIQQWSGSSYFDIARLPSTQTPLGPTANQHIWMRTSFLLRSDLYFDYEPETPGKNVLLQFTRKLGLHRIEATPLD